MVNVKRIVRRPVPCFHMAAQTTLPTIDRLDDPVGQRKMLVGKSSAQG